MHQSSFSAWWMQLCASYLAPLCPTLGEEELRNYVARLWDTASFLPPKDAAEVAAQVLHAPAPPFDGFRKKIGKFSIETSWQKAGTGFFGVAVCSWREDRWTLKKRHVFDTLHETMEAAARSAMERFVPCLEVHRSATATA